MRFTNLYVARIKTLIDHHQATPLLVSLTLLFLLFYPASQLRLDEVTLHATTIALSFGLSMGIIGIGLFEASRKKRIKISILSFWLLLCTGTLAASSLYQHAEFDQAFSQILLTFLGLLGFIALQQFHFRHKERQYLLWLPLYLGWLYLPCSFTVTTEELIPKLTSPVNHLDPNTNSIPLLTSFAVSAYLLARLKQHDTKWKAQHIPLLLTPFLTIPAVMAWQQPWLITPIVAIFLMVQAYLFKYCQRTLHAAWNIMALVGFFLADLLGYVPSSALFSERFSPDEWEIMAQSIELMMQTRFQGVGLGQLEQAQLLFGHAQNNVLPVLTPYPSWLLGLFIEGGVTTWLPMAVLVCLMLKRFMIAPSATRLILLAVFMPSLLGMMFSSYAATQPMLILLFVLLLYWLDNLSTHYFRFKRIRTRPLRLFACSSLALITILTVSSLYLTQQAKQVSRMNNNQLVQFKLHPWWFDFYDQHMAHRLYLQSILQEDQEGKDAYLISQIKALAKKPNPSGYQNLIKLAEQTQNHYMAKQIADEAKRLFPMHHFILHQHETLTFSPSRTQLTIS